MNSISATPLGDGLVYEDEIPLRWRPLSSPPVPMEQLRQHDTNEETLRYILALEERYNEPAEEAGPYTAPFAALDFKLNLLLDMMGQLLVSQKPLPPLHVIRMNANGIEWLSAEDGVLGGLGTVELYLSPKCPRPLWLTGVMEVADEGPNGRCLGVRFTQLGDDVRDTLEKLLFRRHRRSVHLTRHTT